MLIHNLFVKKILSNLRKKIETEEDSESDRGGETCFYVWNSFKLISFSVHFLANVTSLATVLRIQFVSLQLMRLWFMQPTKLSKVA